MVYIWPDRVGQESFENTILVLTGTEDRMRLVYLGRILVETGGVLVIGLFMAILSVGLLPLGLLALFAVVILREMLLRGNVLKSFINARVCGPDRPPPFQPHRLERLIPLVQMNVISIGIATSGRPGAFK